MGSQAPALTPSPCCVTLLPPSSSHHLLSEPESGEMRATEPLSPTPTVLQQRPTEPQTPPTRPPRPLPPLPHLRDPHLRQEEERGHRGRRRDQHGREDDGHVPGHYRIRGVHGESCL